MHAFGIFFSGVNFDFPTIGNNFSKEENTHSFDLHCINEAFFQQCQCFVERQISCHFENLRVVMQVIFAF